MTTEQNQAVISADASFRRMKHIRESEELRKAFPELWPKNLRDWPGPVPTPETHLEKEKV